MRGGPGMARLRSAFSCHAGQLRPRRTHSRGDVGWRACGTSADRTMGATIFGVAHRSAGPHRGSGVSARSTLADDPDQRDDPRQSVRVRRTARLPFGGTPARRLLRWLRRPDHVEFEASAAGGLTRRRPRHGVLVSDVSGASEVVTVGTWAALVWTGTSGRLMIRMLTKSRPTMTLRANESSMAVRPCRPL